MTDWRGNGEESRALVDAIANNCGCQFSLMGARVSTCVPHEALINDQCWLDHLLFYRRLRDKLLDEEGIGVTPAA